MTIHTNRRTVIGAGVAIGLTSNALAIAASAAQAVTGRSPDDVARDEAYWRAIASAYRLDGRYVVLNGGGNNPQPGSVIDALDRYNRMAGAQPRPHNYTLYAHRHDHRRRLARLMGAQPEEVAITRNTTEGLNIVIWGLSMEPGDEILMSEFEERYAAYIVNQRAARHGVVARTVSLPLSPSVDDVVSAFRAQITPRTKLIVASHLVDGWGYNLPIRELAALAHEHEAQVLVDGALSFSQIPVDMRALDCDYFATSLHKWLNAPLGTGALFVRQDRIADLWPLYGVPPDRTDIGKFEYVGTVPGPTYAAIGQAIDFYEQIGPERKAARVRYLLAYLTDALAPNGNVRVVTERDPARRAGLARIAVSGTTGRNLTRTLREDFGIYTWGNFPGPNDGVYVSPNVFNTPADMDRFAAALAAISGAA
ncbi:aminotransferase class V-fold PLP-dependent enzyme [Parasphingopyxis sp.]|uniref:aminotransferase class V-fold PLP-dependent enzyme n=1 Tax=Parasphingopyxis sp. TaxID=1920299 RepID=UPI0026044257|nr:aminotransferase class V-fold PLP-dependent enzyme [Parasphingopyxis sp.]